MIKAPLLTLPRLERHAAEVLAEYAATICGPVPMPVPVEEIAMYQLTYRIEFADLHALLRIPKRGDAADIHGAFVFEKDTILIDSSLDPKAHPGRLVRYRYSLGHEICHGRVHRKAYLKSKAREGRPDIVCGGWKGKKPHLEWQADFFSSFLLMPRERVIEAWGDQRPFAFNPYRHGSEALQRIWRNKKSDGRVARTKYKAESDSMFDVYAEPLARRFQVSNEAMRNRLEKMGLLNRMAPWQQA